MREESYTLNFEGTVNGGQPKNTTKLPVNGDMDFDGESQFHLNGENGEPFSWVGNDYSPEKVPEGTELEGEITLKWSVPEETTESPNEDVVCPVCGEYEGSIHYTALHVVNSSNHDMDNYDQAREMVESRASGSKTGNSEATEKANAVATLVESGFSKDEARQMVFG